MSSFLARRPFLFRAAIVASLVGCVRHPTLSAPIPAESKASSRVRPNAATVGGWDTSVVAALPGCPPNTTAALHGDGSSYPHPRRTGGISRVHNHTPVFHDPAPRAGKKKKPQGEHPTMRPTTILLALGLVLLAGCAANPSAVAPDIVSSEAYADYSCKTLRDLMDQKRTDIDELSKAQKTKRVIDGVSNVLLLPGAASLFDDSSKPLGRAKGEMMALTREYDRRCIERE